MKDSTTHLALEQDKRQAPRTACCDVPLSQLYWKDRMTWEPELVTCQDMV